MQELRAGNLRQTDGTDVASILAEETVHFLVHPLRLDRHFVEVCLALQGAFAFTAGFSPGFAVLELASGLPLASYLEEYIEGGACVGDDAEVRGEYAADLGRFDVHVHKRAAFGVDVDRASMAIGPAIADTEYQIRLEQGSVAVTVRGLQATHARHQRVVIGQGSPAHQGRDYRYTGQFGEGHQLVTGVGVDDTATGDDQRALSGIEHGKSLLGLNATGLGLVHRQRLVGVDVKLDLGHLHVKWQVDQYWAGPAAAHFVKSFLEGIGHLTRLQHGSGPLGHRFDDAGDVDGLEVFLMQSSSRGLPRDAENRNGVCRGAVQASDHVGAGRA
ncbi:hypothetical protein D3C79_419550 [compost metagenome]